MARRESGSPYVDSLADEMAERGRIVAYGSDPRVWIGLGMRELGLLCDVLDIQDRPLDRPLRGTATVEQMLGYAAGRTARQGGGEYNIVFGREDLGRVQGSLAVAQGAETADPRLVQVAEGRGDPDEHRQLAAVLAAAELFIPLAETTPPSQE
jgi:hypothetical protein